jgi:hypothetical protein
MCGDKIVLVDGEWICVEVVLQGAGGEEGLSPD